MNDSRTIKAVTEKIFYEVQVYPKPFIGEIIDSEK